MHPITSDMIERVRNMWGIVYHIRDKVTYYITLVCIIWSVCLTLIIVRMDRDILNRDVLITEQEKTIAKWINNCSPKPSRIARQ